MIPHAQPGYAPPAVPLMFNPMEFQGLDARDVVDVAYARHRGLRIPAQAEPDFREALGVGSYGVVYPTQSRRVVFKVTEDDEEARFVYESMQDRDPPVGVVRYYGIVGVSLGRRLSQSAWLLWRESADVGRSFLPDRGARDSPGIRLLNLARRAARSLVENTSTVRELRTAVAADDDVSAVGFAEEQIGNHLRGGRRDLSSAFISATRGQGVRHARVRRFDAQTYKRALQRLGEMSPRFQFVAEAMLFYLIERDGVMYDVRDDNLGVVHRRSRDLSMPSHRGGEKVMVITDPGLTAFYGPRSATKKQIVGVYRPPRRLK